MHTFTVWHAKGSSVTVQATDWRAAVVASMRNWSADSKLLAVMGPTGFVDVSGWSADS